VLLYDIMRRGANEYPQRPAIHFRDTTFTYGDLANEVNRLANALRREGIGPADRVGLLLPNCPTFTIAYYAITALGAVCVPANPLLKPAELTHMWGDSDVKLVFTIPALLPHVRQVRQSVPSLQVIVNISEQEDASADAIPYVELLRHGTEEPLNTHHIQPSDPAVCIYTSGTTGRPKGALLSHHNLTVNCRQIVEVLHIDSRDNFLCVLPLFHSFAGTVCQNTALFCGAQMTLLEQFQPARVLEAIHRYRVTIFAGVPAMYQALLQFSTDPPPDFSRVRLCVSGGAPMPVALMKAFEERFKTIIIEGDGPTECSPVTCVNPPEGVRKPGSVGLPIPGVEMKIFDENDRELPIGEVGEIVVRGENVMLGYHNLPEETAEAMRNGWYHTGDLGKMDEDGYFYIVDRKKDMVIVGGLNVYPREVEEVLFTHPAVADAAVIGLPDPLRGEEVVAIIVLKPGQQATERELIQHCRLHLANYKVPRRVLFREALPRSGTGKVLKRLLRKELELETA
jgi:long-chain acyl-CoA synthetase